MPVATTPLRRVRRSRRVARREPGRRTSPPHTDQPHYVGYNVDGQEIALDPNGHRKGLTGPVPYWPVDDITGRVATLVAAGATLVQEPTDVGGERRTAVLADPDGNHVGLPQDA